MENKILCPDCLINEITQEDLDKYGRCLTCRRRVNAAALNKVSYIPFSYLSLAEREKILKKRECNNRWVQNKFRQKRGEEKLPTISNETYNYEILDGLIKENGNLSIAEMYLKAKDIKGLENVTDKIIRKRINALDLPYRKVKTEGHCDYIPRQTKNLIYTQEMIEFLKSIEDENLTVTEIFTKLQNKYPDNDKITRKNFNNIIARHNILHKKGKSGRVKREEIIQEASNLICIPEEEHTFSSIIPTEIEEDFRFEPIKAEVRSVLNDKYQKLNCAYERKYNTQDYINMLTMLQELTSLAGAIVAKRHDQWDVMNAYQNDIVHEIENTIVKSGDTYLTDKLHILREERRACEYDINDLNSMKDFLSTLSINKITLAIEALRKLQETRDNIVYIPEVDSTLVNKYEWAKTRTNPANKSILVTNSKIRASNKIKGSKAIPPEAKCYRVSCQLSGGGFGAFKHWHSDYTVVSEDTALAYATNTLNQLKSTHDGMIWTNLEIHQLNK